MSKYAKRVDSNHAEIRDYIRELGIWVKDTSSYGNGFSDLIVVHKQEPYFIEIKVDKKAKLTPQEREFKERVGNRYRVIVTKEDVNKLFGIKI